MSKATTDTATLDPPMTADTLVARRTALEARSASLRLERAAAVLAGQQTDATALQTAETELDALDDAEAELVRRERADALATKQAERRAKSARALELLIAWVAGIDDQEAAARAFVAAMKQTEAIRAEVQALVYQILGSVPNLLDMREQEIRRSHGLCAVLRHRPDAGRFGELALADAVPRDAPWATAERLLAETITLQLNEATQ